MKKLLLLLCMAILASCSSKPVQLIFDTDMGPNYDDVGALAILHAMADSREVDILATVTSNKMDNAAPCIEVINTYFGRADIPLGGPKGVAPDLDTWHAALKWTAELPARYPHKVKSTSEAENAVTVYRRVLASKPDISVTIVTIGFLSNLRDLLRSAPDEYSSLSGRELVEAKVKEVVMMAGINAPEQREFNVVMDPEASKYVFDNWPTKITVSGWDIGVRVITGKQTAAMEVTGSPIKDAYEITLAQDDPQGRMSWDQTAVLVAVRGPGEYYSVEQGTLVVDETGKDFWTPGEGKHYKLVEKMSPEKVAAVIEEMMIHQPEK